MYISILLRDEDQFLFRYNEYVINRICVYIHREET